VRCLALLAALVAAAPRPTLAQVEVAPGRAVELAARSEGGTPEAVGPEAEGGSPVPADGPELEHLSRVAAVEWAPEIERGCERRAGMRYASCDGPRRVALPSEEAAERAARLGLGGHEAADALWTGAPPEEWAAEAGERHDGLLWPVAAGLFSRGFGAGRVHDHVAGSHAGLDVVAAEGAHLRAVDDGLVAYADNGVRGLGNVLFLVLGDGSVALYAHCESLIVAAGERVRRGQIVGTLGRTGLTVRAHLHFELRVGGEPRDPLPEMRERPGWRIRDEEDGVVSWREVPPNLAVAEDTAGADPVVPEPEAGEAKADVAPPEPPAIVVAVGGPGGEAEERTR
jgi:murein DD-endopeptidase MepM/ murein hydrolase activator NlpD